MLQVTLVYTFLYCDCTIEWNEMNYMSIANYQLDKVIVVGRKIKKTQLFPIKNKKFSCSAAAMAAGEAQWQSSQSNKDETRQGITWESHFYNNYCTVTFSKSVESST